MGVDLYMKVGSSVREIAFILALASKKYKILVLYMFSVFTFENIHYFPFYVSLKYVAGPFGTSVTCKRSNIQISQGVQVGSSVCFNDMGKWIYRYHCTSHRDI